MYNSVRDHFVQPMLPTPAIFLKIDEVGYSAWGKLKIILFFSYPNLFEAIKPAINCKI